VPKALVTGAAGFVGPYLCRHLRDLGYEVWGGSVDGAPHPDYASLRVDVTNRSTVLDAIRNLQPDEVYHLAALSRPTLDDQRSYYEVNLHGTLHVLEAARAVGAQVLVASSAYVYGARAGAIAEDVPLRPMNAYGASKAAAEMATVAAAAGGLHAVIARPFNHSGPGQPPAFFVPTLVQQLAALRDGRADAVLRLGNLDAVRDLSDVRDVVRAYPLLLRHGRAGEAYNVGRGEGWSMREVVEEAAALLERSVQVIVDPDRLRPNDLPELVADTRKLLATIDWQATIPLERTLRDMLPGAEDGPSG
jgi:GDP-4-dehydro-6-deoxy-D-mannose reductase